MIFKTGGYQIHENPTIALGEIPQIYDFFLARSTNHCGILFINYATLFAQQDVYRLMVQFTLIIRDYINYILNI